VSGDFAIGAILPGLVPVSGTPGGSVAPVSSNGTAGAVSSAGSPPNPSVYLDPALNLVVLAFFDAQGNLTSTVPSEQQLQAYQRNGTPGSTAGGQGGTVSEFG